MRKRSKYRPKRVMLNPHEWVRESVRLVSNHDDYLIKLRIKNHAAFAALTQGKATKDDMQTLIAMNNVTNALFALNIGKQYEPILHAGGAALINIGSRGLKSGRFIVRAEDMSALNDLMDLHDAQMDAIDIRTLERALDYIENLEREKNYIRIEETA